MYEVCVIGAGYVGLVTSACLASLGNRVACLERDGAKLHALRTGHSTIAEPGLQALLDDGLSTGRLTFDGDPGQAIGGKRIVMVAVGTPIGMDGAPDVRAVTGALEDVRRSLDGPATIVMKSTVPVGTTSALAATVARRWRPPYPVHVVSNPEFLRESSAVQDFFEPDRVVIGVGARTAEFTMRRLYAPLRAPTVVTTTDAAEMIKYASNAFLAAKLSMASEVARIAAALGVEQRDVLDAVGMDERIGASFLRAGLGYGGSCLPKDLAALRAAARDAGVADPMLSSIASVNASVVEHFAASIASAMGPLPGKRIAVLGAAFKGSTDDVRESPALALVRRLLSCGAFIALHDPLALDSARSALGDAVEYDDTWSDAVRDADAVVIATDHPEYAALDPLAIAALMSGDSIFDGWCTLNRDRCTQAGLRYTAVHEPRKHVGRRAQLGDSRLDKPA